MEYQKEMTLPDYLFENPVFIGKSKIFDCEKDDISYIRRNIPMTYHLDSWNLLYSTEQHGISHKTFIDYSNDGSESILIFIKDSNDYKFGCFITDTPYQNNNYYGSDESFLFSLSPKKKIYKSTKKNNYYIHCSNDSISFGTGGNGPGIWLDIIDFEHGSSNKSDTYDNEPLASNIDFDIILLEVWGFIKFGEINQ
eukprot:TRINITY_DN1366_c1_g3_i1.p1 TRINITY_DN1366_c1_g3~~TRINITY_DN1366_c1_g3_i1.p1  ORF type:complete len:206 (+),score=61.11 TRINITY_DN1366_c1_g3_i1:31-618(+)